MAQVVKKFISQNAVDQTKILLDNAGWFRALKANATEMNVFRVNPSDEIEFSKLPFASGTPTQPSELVNKSYVDYVINGLKWKRSVDLASAGDVPLSGSGTLLIDGTPVTNGMRVLLKDQTAPAQNGIYDATVGGGSFLLTRATDADDGSDFPAAVVAVEEGSANDNTIWLCTNNTDPVVGTDAIAYIKYTTIFDLIAGDGLSKVSDTLSVNTDGNTTRIDGSNNVAVKLDGAGGLTSTASGIKIKLQSSNPSLAIDGSNQLGVKLDPAGAIITGTSGIKVDTDGTTTQISANKVAAKLDPAGALAASGSGIAVQLETVNPTLQIVANKLGVKISSTASGLTQDSNGLKVKVDSSSDATTRINGSGELVAAAEKQETKTLSGTDISNGYVNLAMLAVPNCVELVVSGVQQRPGTDFTLSTVGGVTRVTFAGDLTDPGKSQLSSGDVLYFAYRA